MEGGGEGVFARHPLQKVAILLLTIAVGGKATIIGTCSQLAYINIYDNYIIIRITLIMMTISRVLWLLSSMAIRFT